MNANTMHSPYTRGCALKNGVLKAFGQPDVIIQTVALACGQLVAHSWLQF